MDTIVQCLDGGRMHGDGDGEAVLSLATNSSA